jgi:DNA repair protein RadD
MIAQLNRPTLRDYQSKVVRDLYDQIRRGYKRILIVAGTGAGKTVISGQITNDAESRRRRVLFLVHLDVLVGQTYSTFKSFGIECGFIKAGFEENPDALVQIASVQTLPRRHWWKKYQFDVVIWDEAHRSCWADISGRIFNDHAPNAIHIGLTATPWLTSKRRGMGDLFQTLVLAPSPKQLMEQGYLAPLKYYGFENLPDLTGIGTQAGDFKEDELAIAVDTDETVGRIVAEYQRLASGRRALCFAVKIPHSRHIEAAFNAAGIPAIHVDGSTPIKERKRIYAAFRNGVYRVLTSVDVLGIGFDDPGVSCGILARPTKSPALDFQQRGRIMRPDKASGKVDGLILDFAGNVDRHGFVEDLTEDSFSLVKGKEPGTMPPPLKLCPPSQLGCGRYIYSFMRQCPHCAHEFPAKERIQLSGNLVPLEGSRKISGEMRQFFEGKAKQAYSRGASPDWACVEFERRFGCWPKTAHMLGAVFGDNPTKGMKSVYKSYLQAVAVKKGKDDKWVGSRFKREFGVDT